MCMKNSFPVSDLAIAPAGAWVRLGAVTPPRVAPSLRLPLRSARVTDHLRVTLVPGGTPFTPTTREFRRTVPTGHLTVDLQVTVSREPENGAPKHLKTRSFLQFSSILCHSLTVADLMCNVSAVQTVNGYAHGVPTCLQAGQWTWPCYTH